MLDKKPLIGGMDSDTDLRYVENGDWLYALNVRASKTGAQAMGAVENVKSTSKVLYSLPSGGNKVIGRFFDKKNNVGFYFVYNDANSHCILMYDPKADAITRVIQSSLLNFSPDYPILHVDRIDDLLFWTDGNNEPCYVNVTNASTGVYSYSTRQYFDAIQYAPLQPPTGGYNSDASKGVNNLSGKLFQFRYRWVYDDNQISASSPASKLILPESESAFIDQYASSTINNVIEVFFNTGIDRVKKLQLMVREGNNLDWFIVKEFVKSEEGWGDNQTESFNFYNDEIYTAVDQTEVNRLFDYVPLKAECQSLIDGGRMSYSNITEGYDNIEVDASVSLTYEEPITQPDSRFWNVTGTDTPASNPGGTDNLTITPIGGLGTATQDFYLQAINAVAGEQFIYSISATYSGIGIINETFTYNAVGGETTADLAAWITDSINNSTTFNRTVGGYTLTAVAGAVTNPTITPKWLVEVTFTHFLASVPVSLNVSQSIRVTNIASYVSLKRAAKHSIGIVYQDDAGRVSLVQKDDAMDFNVLPYNETPGQEGKVTANLTINHAPPSWATRYSIVYSGNTTAQDFIYAKIATVTPSGSEYSLYLTDAGIPTGFAKYNADNNQKTSLTYDWSRGDRIWFIKDSAGAFRDEYVDIQINNAGTFAGGYYVTVDLNIPITPAAGDIIQIYTPSKGVSEKLYYETGETFAIVNGQHQGNTQNQSSGIPAILSLNIGDVYYRYRNSIYAQFVEDYSFSDYYTSNYWSKGRPNIVDKNYKQTKRYTSVYYSEPYIPETNINGLSTIYSTSFESYQHAFGEIKKTYVEDERLYLFQQLKTGFVVVNRNVLYNANGTPNGVVGQSNAVLSQINYYDGKYGIGNNPESFAVYGNRKYHVDTQNGVVLRLSIDGYTPISEYKMHNYFTDKFRSLQNDFYSFRCWGEYDFRHDEYILSFVQVTQTETVYSNKEGFNRVVYSYDDSWEVISFSEDKKKWVTFYSYTPDCLMMTSAGLVGFKDGTLWKHDSGTTYGNFYGTQYTSKIKFVGNAMPLAIKFFNGVVVDSNAVWSCPAIESLFGSQESSLAAADFEQKEGVWYAAMLRDQNTPNIANPLFEGDMMRDYAISVTLENNNTDYVRIISAGVRSEPSMLTMQ